MDAPIGSRSLPFERPLAGVRNPDPNARDRPLSHHHHLNLFTASLRATSLVSMRRPINKQLSIEAMRAAGDQL
jgi:hypothetical protein